MNGDPLFLLYVGPYGGRVSASQEAAAAVPGVEFRHDTYPPEAQAWAIGRELVAVVVNHTLPVGDGLTFVQGPHTPANEPRPHIVLLTDGASAQDIATAEDEGADDVLDRTVSRSSFVALLRAALEFRLAERAVWDRSNIVNNITGPPAPDERGGALPRPLVAALAVVVVVALGLLALHR